MNRILFFVAAFLAAAGCIGWVSAASAYGLSGVGAKLGFLDPDTRDGTAAIDVHLEFEEPGSRWHLVPGFMYWESDGLSDRYRVARARCEESSGESALTTRRSSTV